MPIRRARWNKGSKNVFFVPPVAHWAYLRDNARKAEIGVMVDPDLDVIETENQALTDRQKFDTGYT